MGLSFRKKSAKNYVQFTTRYEEDLMIKIRDIHNKTGLSINEILNIIHYINRGNMKLIRACWSGVSE